MEHSLSSRVMSDTSSASQVSLNLTLFEVSKASPNNQANENTVTYKYFSVSETTNENIILDSFCVSANLEFHGLTWTWTLPF